MTKFTDLPLSPATQSALVAMGMTTPTPIQSLALPLLLAGRDLIGQARTGSGKTLAFSLPLVERVDPRQRAVQALVLAPTRELATQVGGVLAELGQQRGLRTVLVYGGRAIGPQEAAIRAGAQIIVGAPGRVLDLLRRGTLNLSQVRYLVLDEADEMLDRGFAPDVERILAHAPRERQTALFSATVPPWVHETAQRYLRNPETVQVDTRPEDQPKIEHVVYDVPAGDKLDVLKLLLDARGDGSTIVFGRTKHGVKKLGRQLEVLGYPVAALQGNLSQNARDRVMEDFRSGAAAILLATNVAARGLDVESVEQVINFDLPESAELLTHRVGRTGRMGREGRAITLLGPDDGPKWRQLERAAGRTLPRMLWRDEYAATPPAVPTATPAAPQKRVPESQRTWNRPVLAGVVKQHDQRQTVSRRPLVTPGTGHQTVVQFAEPIICAKCGCEATVPFVPRPDRPVYCRECFRQQHQAGKYGAGQGGANRRDGRQRLPAESRREARATRVLE